MNKITDWVKIHNVKSLTELMLVAEKYNNKLNVVSHTVKDNDSCNIFYAYYSLEDLGNRRPLAVSEECYFSDVKILECNTGSVLCNCGKGGFEFVKREGKNLIECPVCGYSYEDNMIDRIGGDKKFR